MRLIIFVAVKDTQLKVDGKIQYELFRRIPLISEKNKATLAEVGIIFPMSRERNLKGTMGYAYHMKRQGLPQDL